ncbi:hypothetical protein [Halovenus halobia]|jgi:hypothetical protein|uniref:hypothetical protein n=1 Tax=Halovenus halobia TaxID=3396622 RepID=UPI003F56A04E
MHYRRVLGIGLTAAGILGYFVGVYAAYPGRAFSLTLTMVGITLAFTTPATEAEL